MLGGDDESGVDAPLLQFLGGVEAGNRQRVLAKIDVVVFQQTLRQLADAGAFLADGDALAAQIAQALDGLETGRASCRERW